MLGAAVDIGRLYIAKNEAQAYSDAAALAAVLELDGTTDGITRALARVSASANRWNLGTRQFTGTQTDFATAAGGPWEANPSPATGYRFARVRASVAVPLYLIPIVVSKSASTVRATAVAGQVPKTNFSEGILPFSPYTHNSNPPHFGYTPGINYTLRWGSNPKVGQNVCPGDDAAQWVAQAHAAGASDRGYIEENSASIIRASIVDNYQTRPLEVGDTVTMTGGNKQTERDSLVTRIWQDTDPYSANYAQYVASDTGNGRRIVVVPMNNGSPDFTVMGFAAFFLLLPSEYDAGGNRPFCAEYIGPYLQGSRRKGAGEGGASVARLVL